MGMMAVPWLVLELTDSPSQVALTGIFQTIPMFLLGFFAGGLADRFSKKWLLFGTNALASLAALGMVLVIAAGMIQPWQAFLYVFMSGVTMSINMPARQSYISELFGAAQLPRAISLDSVVMTGTWMLGPALGGWLMELTGYRGVFTAMAALYSLGTGLLIFLGSDTERSTTSKDKVKTAVGLREAARQIWASQTFRAVLIGTVVVTLFGYSYRNLVSVFARDVLGVDASLYGLMGSATGLGSLIGSLIIASVHVRRPGLLFSTGIALLLVSLLLFSFSSLYPLSLFLLFSVGIGSSILFAMQYTIALQSVTPDLSGRVVGSLSLAIGFGPLGMYLLGYLTEAIGPPPALALMTATGLVLMGLLAWRFPELIGRPTHKRETNGGIRSSNQ